MRNKYTTKSSLKTMLLASIVGAGLVLGGCKTSLEKDKIQFIEKNTTDLETENPNQQEIKQIATESKSDIGTQKKSLSISDITSHFEVSLIEDEKIYFPLAERNTWTYTKTLKNYPSSYMLTGNLIGVSNHRPLPSSSPFSLAPAKEEKEAFPKVSEETYTVVEKANNGLWKVKVEGDNPRDERYEFIENKEDPRTRYVYWVYKEIGLTELREDKYDEIGETWLGTLRTNILGASSDLQMMAVKHQETITVPAGTFTDVIKSAVMVLGASNLEEVLMKNVEPEYRYFSPPIARGFITESYFAKDVGLIKEIQYNDRGEETYRLELKSYNLK